MSKTYNRRDFIRQGGTIGAGLALANIGGMIPAAAQENDSAQKSTGGKLLLFPQDYDYSEYDSARCVRRVIVLRGPDSGELDQGKLACV